jgi:hypothetical protein
MTVTIQRVAKQVSAAKNKHTIIEKLLEVVSSIWSFPEVIKGVQRSRTEWRLPCGGGVEYLHRSPEES